MGKAKVYIFEKQFEEFPKEDDIKLIEEELPPLKDGEFLAEALYLSVDPYMRSWAPKLTLGTTFIGTQVAKIIESKNSNYPVGRYVRGTFGWRSHTVSNGKSIFVGSPDAYLIPTEGEFSPSYFLGIFGMPGCTAYFGLLEIIKPKKGETIVVTGAAGAVGSIVGQIAKIKGCKVIGIAGSDEKGKWLTEELGFDYFINYKTADLNKVLSEYAPDGIDGYFDNVGGEITATVLSHMKTFGRIAICGSISGYNEKDPKATPFQRTVVFSQLKMEGFSVHRWRANWQTGILELIKWYNEGKLKHKETKTKGFDNIFNAFVNMLRGGNTGKAIVEI